MPPATKKAVPAAVKPAEGTETVEAEAEALEFCPTPAECFPHGIQAGYHHAMCIHGEWHLPTE